MGDRRSGGFFSTSGPMSPHCGSWCRCRSVPAVAAAFVGDRLVETRTKAKAADRTTTPLAKADVTRPTRPRRSDAGAEAEGGQRVGVQSLGRAFAILEEVARHREGIGLADLSKRVGLHNSTTFHLAKTMVSLGYIRQARDTKRYRVGRPLFALAASALDEIEMVNLAT